MSVHEYASWHSSPVPTHLIDKIESSAFYQNGDLIPNQLKIDDAAPSKLCCSFTNIRECLQAFAEYVSVIAMNQLYCVLCSQPHRVPDSDPTSQ